MSTTTEPNLLNCPFCGSYAEFDFAGAHCASIDCHAHTIKGFTAEEWNRRSAVLGERSKAGEWTDEQIIDAFKEKSVTDPAKVDFGMLLISSRRLVEVFRALSSAPAQAAQSEDANVLAEHSGCGMNPQWEQVSARLNPGDKIVLIKGEMTKAFERAMSTTPSEKETA